MIFLKSGQGCCLVALLICGAILATVAAQYASPPVLAAEKDAVGPEWLVHTCEKYGFSIKYPAGYRVIEAKPRSETKSIWGAEVLSEFELHKITFIETEYEMWYGQFGISVMPNENGYGLEEWVDSFMENEDIALNMPDPEDRSIFGVGEVIVDGHEVVRLHFFNFDHTGIELFVAHGGYIYNLSFAGSNPNDPNVEEHKAIFNEMVESFEFEK